MSKKRQRNKAHVGGPKDDTKETVVFETTLVAEKGQTKDDLSPLAERLAERVFDMVKQKGYEPKEIWNRLRTASTSPCDSDPCGQSLR